MRVQFHFVNLPRSAAFEREFETHLASLERQFSFRRRDEAVKAHVRFIATAFSSVGKLLEVEVEVQLFVPHRKDYVVCRKGKDLKLVSVAVISALERMLRRENKKRESGRHTYGKTRRRLRHADIA